MNATSDWLENIVSKENSYETHLLEATHLVVSLQVIHLLV